MENHIVIGVAQVISFCGYRFQYPYADDDVENTFHLLKQNIKDYISVKPQVSFSLLPPSPDLFLAFESEFIK